MTSNGAPSTGFDGLTMSTTRAGLTEDDMVCGCCGCFCCCHGARAEHRSREVYRMQRDFLRRKRYISGTFCKDYCFYLVNYHPLLGMFFAHPQHPWSCKERVTTFIVSSALRLVPSAMVVWLIMKIDDEIEDNKDVLQEWYVDHLIVFGCVTMPVSMFEIFMYQLGVLDTWCRGRGRGSRGRQFCDCLANAMKALRIFCISFALAMALMVFAMSIIIIAATEAPLGSLMKPFLLAEVQSWVVWLPLYFFMPCKGFLHRWCKERTACSSGDTAGVQDDADVNTPAL